MPVDYVAKMLRTRIFRKSPVGAYLRANEWLWRHIPYPIRMSRVMTAYGRLLHALVLLMADRRQYVGTFFLRNRPQLELIKRLCSRFDKCASVRIAVLGCSNGAEVYSILSAIRSARPDLRVVTCAMDISREMLDFAQEGLYSPQSPGSVDARIFERITDREMEELFDQENGRFKIKSWIKDGITWHLGDAGDPNFPVTLGPQDIVVANNFLCHMSPRDAQKVARNVARLVIPRGYLCISGIDLNVRAKLADELGWKPVVELLEDIHEGDPVVRNDWPFCWWGLEPLNKTRKDLEFRYATVFRLE